MVRQPTRKQPQDGTCVLKRPANSQFWKEDKRRQKAVKLRRVNICCALSRKASACSMKKNACAKAIITCLSATDHSIIAQLKRVGSEEKAYHS